MASPITTFRKACELGKRKVAASREVPLPKLDSLDVPRWKKIMYKGGEKEKLERLEAYKPHDLGEVAA
jgi:hypothetical protein